jgi:hypothetical protein
MVMSNAIMAVCLLASFRMTMRTRFFRAGVLIALAAGSLGGLMSIVGASVMLAVWHDPATLNEWRHSCGLDEAFVVVPLLPTCTTMTYTHVLNRGKPRAQVSAQPVSRPNLLRFCC